jgi:hypothetical protein
MARSHRRAAFWTAVAGVSVATPVVLGAVVNRFPHLFGLQRLRTLAYGVPPATGGS